MLFQFLIWNWEGWGAIIKIDSSTSLECQKFLKVLTKIINLINSLSSAASWFSVSNKCRSLLFFWLQTMGFATSHVDLLSSESPLRSPCLSPVALGGCEGGASLVIIAQKQTLETATHELVQGGCCLYARSCFLPWAKYFSYQVLLLQKSPLPLHAESLGQLPAHLCENWTAERQVKMQRVWQRLSSHTRCHTSA